MIKLLHQLNALYTFYKSAHWLAKGEYFFQDHLLFAKLYEGLDDEMDTLVELCLAVEYAMEDSDLNPVSILKESAKLTRKLAVSCHENLQIAAELEADVIKTIEKVKVSDTPTGLYNHLAAIAESHTRNGYLLARSLLKSEDND